MNHMSGIAVAYFLNDLARRERIEKQVKQARRSKAADWSTAPPRGFLFLCLTFNYMANFIVRISANNGYSAQEVRVDGVITQAKAKEVVAAQKPGAHIISARPVR